MNDFNSSNDFGFGTQIRKSPFFDSTVKWGAKGFSVYNHMYIPRDFGDPVQNFWNLINDAILCDVAVERQVQIKGPDASKFAQLITSRDLSHMRVGQCKYVILTNQFGGILNDPVLIRVDEDCYWFSLADSDVLFWVLGVLNNTNYDVDISEPDASPLQLQGPKSREIMVSLLGKSINELKYYWFKTYELDGIKLLVSRTGWSSELGYEIFLLNYDQGNELYEKIMILGKKFGLKPGHTSTIRRIEGAMLSYHADMDIKTNPFELGLDKFIDLDKDIDFIGKAALIKIQNEGIKRIQVGLEIIGEPLSGPNTRFWEIIRNNKKIGKITSAVFSPRLKKNIGLGIIDIKNHKIGNEFKVNSGKRLLNCKVVEKPFYDPKKMITKS